MVIQSIVQMSNHHDAVNFSIKRLDWGNGATATCICIFICIYICICICIYICVCICVLDWTWGDGATATCKPPTSCLPKSWPRPGLWENCNALINNGRMLTLVLGLKFCQLSFFQISDFFSRFLWRKPLLEVAALSSWTPGGEIALVRVFSSQQAGKF